MPELHSIILAAGRGTRMKSELPKVLHPVCGKPMIEYVLDITQRLRSLKTYIVVGSGADKVKASLDKRYTFVLQDKQLGTGDAVRCVLPYLKQPNADVLILCGDTPLLEERIVKDLLLRHRRTKAAATLLTAKLNDPSGYGRIIRNAQGHVIDICEEKNATAQQRAIQEINVGVYCFKASVLKQAVKALKPNPLTKEIYLTDTIAWVLSQRMTLAALMTEDETTAFGVNTRIHLAQAQEIIRQRINQKHMLNGVTLIDPATTYIENHVTIGQDTVIYPCSYVHAGVKVGARCRIGPFARIREGSVLADGVEVGNFTEVSRSHLATGVVMKHFSFLGDAVVGRSTNIGAGAVTANYDGHLKHQTRIGNDVFIGSDSVLVAPVTIGDKALVAAGAVVKAKTHIPKGRRAIGVPAKIL